MKKVLIVFIVCLGIFISGCGFTFRSPITLHNPYAMHDPLGYGDCAPTCVRQAPPAGPPCYTSGPYNNYPNQYQNQYYNPYRY
ncbi:MAG: hypothetical protein HQK76_11160 [Desulfobacterales bacterium]|nr:hypothetical protein [Desulfobacterales bacterium]